MPDYRVFSVLTSEDIIDGPDVLESFEGMEGAELLDYVCELAVDPDMHDLADHGWTIEDVFPEETTESHPAEAAQGYRAFSYDVVVSRDVEADDADLAAASVMAELRGYMATGDILANWSFGDGGRQEVREL